MNWEFNYNLYELGWAIFQYAERLVMYPNDIAQIEYCKKEAQKALATCKNDRRTWSIEKFPSKGKRLDGRVTVQVRMNAGTTYGFSYMPEQAKKIFDNLVQIKSEEVE